MQDPLAEVAAAATDAGCITRPDGSIYVRAADAAEVLTYYRDAGASLLGMEAFELKDGGIRPRLDMILDCANRPGSEGCFETATKLIEEWKKEDPPVVVNFVVRGRP